MSRSEAERAVWAGRVFINGIRASDPDQRCHPEADRIVVDGKLVRPGRKLYLAMNKPAGCITAARDPERRPTVYDLLPPSAEGVQAVGRLDADTKGLLIFTSDMEFAAKVSEAGHLEMVYRARLGGRISTESIRSFEIGVELDGRMTLPTRCAVIGHEGDSTWVELTLRETMNRQVRRMWEALGYRVLELERIRIGPVELGSLPPGRIRPLTEIERVLIEKLF